MADDQERMAVFRSLLRYSLGPESAVQRFTAPQVELKELCAALESPYLFGGEPVVLLDECDKLPKKEAETLADFLQNPHQAGFLLLGAKGKTPLAKAVEKRGVILDLSDEKPWEREKRITETLFERAKSAGKRLAPDAAPLLLERMGADASLLQREMEKLICYVGERTTIERSDIFRISSASRTHTIWQVAEEMIWEGGGGKEPVPFQGLVPALRSQLSLGLKIASLLEQRASPEEWGSFLPRMWPKTLEKRKDQVLKKGAPFFRKGLRLLFKLELLSRTGANQEEALLDLFRSSLAAYAVR